MPPKEKLDVMSSEIGFDAIQEVKLHLELHLVKLECLGRGASSPFPPPQINK